MAHLLQTLPLYQARANVFVVERFIARHPSYVNAAINGQCVPTFRTHRVERLGSQNGSIRNIKNTSAKT